MSYDPCNEQELKLRAERKARRNTEMFRKIANVIEHQPQMHYQPSWSGRGEGYLKREIEIGDGETERVVCGTTQCVAGWAVALDKNYTISSSGNAQRIIKQVAGIALHKEDTSFQTAGANILGLDQLEATNLFHTMAEPPMGWPRALRAIGEGVGVVEALRYEVPTCCDCE